MFQEGNEAGGYRHKLFRGNVDEIALAAAHDAIGSKAALVVDGRVGLRDDEGFLAIGCEVIDVRGDFASLYLAIRRLQKAKVVDAGKRCQRCNQTDVWPFRRFDRANAAIMGRVYIADFESSAIPGKTSRPESRQTPLVSQLRQRIDLVHE